MRRLIVTIVVLAAAVLAMTAPAVDAKYTSSSMKKQKSRTRGSKRSADSGSSDLSTEQGMPVSSSSTNTAQLGVKGGYSFSDLDNTSSGKNSQKQPSSATSTASTTAASTTTTTSAKQSAVVKADNVTTKVPLGKSQAAAVPLTPETPAYSEETDPKQTDVEVPSPSPSTPAKTSLGESQVAGHPVVSTPTPAPAAEDEEEAEEEPQDPRPDDAYSPKQTYI